MPIIFALLLLAALIFAPQWWARSVLHRHSVARADIRGTGGELAQHLIRRCGMEGVQVESTGDGQDHYDPQARCVRLGENNYSGRSLTAITVAAHEVGHAIQHYQGYRPLALRTRLVLAARGFERFGAFAMIAIPVLAVLTRSPSAGAVLLLVGLTAMATATLVHAVTLPVELDASFRKALPILERGGYLAPADRKPARRILTACALTYLAASLISLVNVGRWLALLRRA
ncbi:MAG: zinc metallopeptidase [Gammaproteobacteria bacterium]|jgi:hypothetical protein|nr:zinc metallopeptidase [Gammaproteobacteria bacterium]